MVHVKIDDNKGIEQTRGTGLEIVNSTAHSGFSPFKLETSGSAYRTEAFSISTPGLYFLSGSTAMTATLPSPGDNPGSLFTLTNNPAGGTYFVTASARVQSNVAPFGSNGIFAAATTIGATLKVGNSMTCSGTISLLCDGLRYVPLAASGNFSFNA